MLTKKKLLARIEALEERVKYLENMHARTAAKSYWELPAFVETIDGFIWLNQVGYYRDRQLTTDELRFKPAHPLCKMILKETYKNEN